MDLIPITKNVPNLSQNQTLDGTDYIFHVKWNMRGGWFFGLSDANDDTILSPRQMTVGSDLLAPARFDARCPPGQLFVIDFTGKDIEPAYLDLVAGATQTDLQGRVGLVYVPLDDPDLLV
jgi:uncharacterized protein DUF6983